MDTDPETVKCFFDDLSQKNQTEIHSLLKNLKHIGFEDDVIERLSHEYYQYFQRLNKDRELVKPKSRPVIKQEPKPSSSSVVWTDQAQKELLPSVEPELES